MRRDASTLLRRTPSSSGGSGRRAATWGSGTTDRRARRVEAAWPSCAQGPEQLAQALRHLRGGPCAIRGPDEHVERAQLVLLQPEGFANASFDAVALGGGRGVLSRYEDSEPRPAFLAPLEVEDVARKVAPRTCAQQSFELRSPPQSAPGIESEALVARGYSPRRRRPRARRLRSTARPPRVRLRTRKPWRRARRVFDG